MKIVIPASPLLRTFSRTSRHPPGAARAKTRCQPGAAAPRPTLAERAAGSLRGREEGGIRALFLSAPSSLSQRRPWSVCLEAANPAPSQLFPAFPRPDLVVRSPKSGGGGSRRRIGVCRRQQARVPHQGTKAAAGKQAASGCRGDGRHVGRV
ncbi:hypothetical protein C2845_PM08G16410 [Panicum miliaceum]|uniref:Uncharacterized protein n=1 Tax=Panicum miliaceum TaxID=4540 RepID=A0A3L6QX40_PANMI|nr:hypothetical protein C2845_PM08G16410 [Panicum miliaceum]